MAFDELTSLELSVNGLLATDEKATGDRVADLSTRRGMEMIDNRRSMRFFFKRCDPF